MIKKWTLSFILGVFLWNSCTTITNRKSDAEYQRDIQLLQAVLVENPTDFSALQNIGIAYYELEKYRPALKNLIRAFKQDPSDGKTMWYLGLTLEAQNREQIALKIYKRYTNASTLSTYRNDLAMRYRILNRKIIQNEIRSLIAKEEMLGTSQIDKKSVAVFPMSYQGRDEQYAALGVGLSEMMITDLTQVRGLKLIDRTRLNALMNEISLGQSGMVDESTAARFGKLLGAGKIIHGNLDVFEGDNLQLSVGYWDMFNSSAPDFTDQMDNLDNLFKLEKDLVFSLLDEMNIDLTPQERERIQRVPTKNIHAFLAYCMGLASEDAGNFEAAAQYYQQSVSMDPQFKGATKKLSVSKMLANADPQFSQPNTSRTLFGGNPTVGSDNLVNSRLNNLNSNIGSYFIPGDDSRESAEEAQTSGVEVFGDLPDPPDLPDVPPQQQ